MAKRFKFNLQTALWHRKVIEDEKKRDFALAQRDTLAAIHDKEVLKSEQARYQQRLFDDQKAKHIDADDIMATHTYLYHLSILIDEAAKNITQLQEIEESKRQALVEATKRKKALERLRERRLKDYMYELDREEQKFMDEMGQIKFVREHKVT